MHPMFDEVPFDAGPPYEPLVQDLDDPAARVRRRALIDLWNHPRPELLERIFHLAHHDRAPSVRRQALILLGRYLWEGEEADYDFPDPYSEPPISREDWRRAEAFLLDYAGDDSIDWGDRRFAVEALGFSGQPEAHRLIERALEHSDPKVRQSAIFAMGRGGWARWQEPLLELLRSDLPRPLLMETIGAVGEMGIDEARKDLLRLTYADDLEIAVEAIWALRTISGPDVFDRLDELVSLGRGKVRAIARETLDEWLMWASLEEEADELDWDDDDDEGGDELF